MLALRPLAFLIFCTIAWAGEDAKPISAARSPAGDLLRKWFAEGTAAGNTGDWYDNRDRTHSELHLAHFPQLQKHVYSEDELKFRRDWAARGSTLPKVTFGNSSTSAPSNVGGSNPRRLYSAPKGMAALYDQYTKNNLFIYPEHQDHDPGHNGVPSSAYGDLYPTNTPYLIISQGSSGTDQPFMRAVPLALAAFRPDVKKKLIESGLLMPTVQMIFRNSNKHLKDAAEYLTGKAHPPVFEGSWVDEVKMVEAAHALQPGDIPPMVQLKVVEEDRAVSGVDFFEDDETEQHADTPCVISRLFRGAKQTRRMVVSAEGSYDLNKRPLTFSWSVLRGDAARIKINYLNDAHSKAELIVPFHARRPDEHDPKIETQRIDIGVFAHNGAHPSAPAFVTWFCFDCEGRTYDANGRIVEIGYGLSETSFSVKDWPGLLDAQSRNFISLGGADLLPAFKRAAEDYKSAQTHLAAARQKRKDAEGARKVGEALKGLDAASDSEVLAALVRETRKRLDADFQTADKAQQAAEKALKEITDSKREDLPKPLQALFENAMNKLKKNTDFAAELKVFAQNEKSVADELAKSRATLEKLGIPREPATVYEKAMLERANGAFLAALAPTLIAAQFRVNFTDPQLTAPKRWRDCYEYDAQGVLLGWKRWDEAAGRSEFTADGHCIVDKDALGRCAKAQSVKYVREGDLKKGFAELWKPLKQVPGDKFHFYTYASGDDRRGKIERSEPVPPPADEKSKPPAAK